MRSGDALLGSVVRSATRARWGFTNETWRVELADGRRVAVQRFASRAVVARRAALQRELAERFAKASVPALPEVLDASEDRIVTRWVEGRVGSDVLEDAAVPVALASAAGRVAVALRRLDVGALDLPALWGSADRLAEASLARLGAADGLLSSAARRALDATIASLPQRFAGRSAVFAHGDLNPTNVILDADGRIVALLDVEFARLAHPAFDASWWDWVIRFHYPTAWPAMRDAFLEAAGEHPPDREDMLVLQKLRALELFTDATPASRGLWLERLERTARWGR